MLSCWLEPLIGHVNKRGIMLIVLGRLMSDTYVNIILFEVSARFYLGHVGRLKWMFSSPFSLAHFLLRYWNIPSAPFAVHSPFLSTSFSQSSFHFFFHPPFSHFRLHNVLCQKSIDVT